MKLVLIDWIDSSSLSGGGWRRVSEIESEAMPVKCRSVGWLVKRTKQFTTIVPHMSNEKGLFPYGQGDMTIPNGQIVTIKTLKC